MQITSKQKKISLAVMAGIGLLLLLRLWTSDLADRAHGPSALAVLHLTHGESQLWVYANERFYQLSEAGKVLGQYPAASFGLTEGITDFQMIADNEILIGDPEAKQILHCRLKPVTCKPLWPANGIALSGLFKFHLDASRQVLFVADNSAHQLFVYPLGGKAARAVTMVGELRYPNAVWVDQQQTVWVADTNHHRIVGLRPDGKRTKPIYKLKATGDKVSATHTWPVAFAKDSAGEMWGLFADGVLRNAELLRFDDQYQVEQRIVLPEGADAVDVVSMAGRILVADLEGMTVQQVDLRDGQVTGFGAAEFQALMQQLGERQQRYQWLSDFCLILMVFLLAVAFWLAKQVSKDETAARQAYLAQHGLKVN